LSRLADQGTGYGSWQDCQASAAKHARSQTCAVRRRRLNPKRAAPPPPRELRAKQDELLQRIARADAPGLEDRATSAEARARQLSATLARKDAALREAREKLEAAEARAAEAARRAGAPVEELERQTKAVARLRADLARKEQALKVGSADLALLTFVCSCTLCEQMRAPPHAV
jgi:DNA repair exonuclease SbcCD ATPase subunit